MNDYQIESALKAATRRLNKVGASEADKRKASCVLMRGWWSWRNGWDCLDD